MSSLIINASTLLVEWLFTILDEFTSDGPVIPQTWNQFYPEDIGYGCDWSEGGGGRKYKL